MGWGGWWDCRSRLANANGETKVDNPQNQQGFLSPLDFQESQEHALAAHNHNPPLDVVWNIFGDDVWQPSSEEIASVLLGWSSGSS